MYQKDEILYVFCICVNKCSDENLYVEDVSLDINTQMRKDEVLSLH